MNSEPVEFDSAWVGANEWVQDEMCNALDAGVFIDRNDPELRAYAERGYRRMLEEEQAC